MTADLLTALAVLSLGSAAIGAVLEYVWHAINQSDTDGDDYLAGYGVSGCMDWSVGNTQADYTKGEP